MSGAMFERMMNGTWEGRHDEIRIDGTSTWRVKIELESGEGTEIEFVENYFRDDE
jgi:hypothetical protein